RRSDIESAVRLSKEFRLRLVIVGGSEAWTMADELAQAKVPVVVEPLTDVPNFNGLRARLDNATLLAAAGVALLLIENERPNFPTLRYAAGNAVRGGLKWDDPLRAITLGPAQALGVADKYGTLEPGKVADVVIWSGDPFEFSPATERVFIRGVE